MSYFPFIYKDPEGNSTFVFKKVGKNIPGIFDPLYFFQTTRNGGFLVLTRKDGCYHLSQHQMTQTDYYPLYMA